MEIETERVHTCTSFGKILPGTVNDPTIPKLSAPLYLEIIEEFRSISDYNGEHREMPI